MNFNTMAKFFIFIFILFLIYSLYNKTSLLQQVKENYKTNNNNTFKMYYVDWCPHCVSAKPHFKKMMKHKKINNNKITYHLIDCEKNPKLAEDAGITGYPTFILNDDKKYEGERSYNHILDYLHKNIN